MIAIIFLVSLLSCGHAYCAYTVVDPEITLLTPKGIQFAYPADGGVTMVSYHYSINQPLSGVAAGQYNVDVNSATNGYFVTQNTAVTVVVGDTVNYWMNVITPTGGFTETDLSWVATASTTPAPAVDTTTTVKTTTSGAVTETTTESSNPETTTSSSSSTQTTTSGTGTGGSGGTCTGTVIACDSYPCDGACDQSVAPCNGLIFEENWDTLDLTRWQHELTMSGGGNWEFEYYTNNRTNSYVRDNTLFIKPTLTVDRFTEPNFLASGTIDLWGSMPADVCTANSFWGCQRTGSGTNYLNPIQSARIRTANSFSFKYGSLEVVAKMPKGDWIWPAIWMVPKDQVYGLWPASGEIDLIEARGNEGIVDSNQVSHGVDEVGQTLHWGPYYGANRYDLTSDSKHLTGTDFSEDFHTYGMNWTENAIKLLIDGEVILTVDPGDGGFWDFGGFDTNQPNSFNPWSGENGNKMTPFDQEFYLILNVAVGGTNGFFSDDWTYTPNAKPWSNTGSTAFRDFWNAKNQWYPTWTPDENNGENAAMHVKSIRVWKDL